MHIAKRLALGVLSPLFIVLLLATAFDVGFVRTATHPATVKHLVSESGIYNSVIPSLLQQTKNISTSLGDVPTSDPDIQKAAKVALPAQFIQENTELAIDNIYQWLDGKIAQPNFNIDLSGAKTLFANNIADSLQKRLSVLPACTSAQNREISQSGFNAYNAACLPRGVSPASAAEQAKAGLVGQQNFLANVNLGASNIKNGSNNQSVFSSGKLASAPKQYQRAKKTPTILIILTVLTGTGIVFLSATWQKGLRHIGINLVVIGLIMLVFSWGLNRAVSTKVIPKIKVDNTILQQDIRNLATDLTQQIDKNYWYFGGVYAVLGVGSIGAAEIFRRRAQAAVANASKSTAGTSPKPKPPAKS